MTIHCLGLNHETAEVHLRERLAFQEETAKAVLARLGRGEGFQPEPIREMVILSTCNRVEIYAVSPEPDFEALEQLIAEVKGVEWDEFRLHLYRFVDEDAIDHLFRVAAGLDSLILGEHQILGQVTAAFELALSQNASGPVLSKLFQAALRGGKRARTETSIGSNPASIASVAIRLAEKVVPDLLEARVGIIGAGDMAELAVEALRKRGVSRIWVVNRTLQKAKMLSEQWGGQAVTFEKLGETLREVDILITSTGAPHTVLPPEMVATAQADRADRPLVIIDIAVPRDVDVEVGQIPGVQLYDIDMLREHLEYSLRSRASEAPRVEAILEQEKQYFLDALRALDVTPIIAELRQRAEAIRQAELDKTLRRMPHLSEIERRQLEALTQALVKKLLHEPTICLRSEAGSPRAAEYATAARSLFGLTALPPGAAGEEIRPEV